MTSGFVQSQSDSTWAAMEQGAAMEEGAAMEKRFPAHRASCQGGERARESQRSSPCPPHFECGDPFETFDNCFITKPQSDNDYAFGFTI